MLGALLGALPINQPHDFLDARPIEYENEDNHWAGDDNRFDDWLLHPDTDEATETESFY